MSSNIDIQKDSFFYKTVTKRKMRFRIKIIVLIIFIFTAYLFHFQIFYAIGDFLIVNNDEIKEPVDVLLIEEGFGLREVLIECGKFYSEGYCKQILFVKTDNSQNIYNDFYMEDILKNFTDSLYHKFPFRIYNLPVEHPITLNKSKEISDTLKKFNVSSILLITNGFHSRRSKKVYENILKDSGIKLYVHSFFDKAYRDDWWKSSDGFRVVVSEYLKYFYYVIRGYI